MLTFQRLDVYQRAIELLAVVSEIIEDLPRGHAERADQLIRAAERWSHQDSTKHYKIARGEAMECAASLDVLRLRKPITPERYERGIRLLDGEVAMLTKMVR